MSREFIVAGDSHIFAMGATRGYQGPLSLAPIGIAECPGYFLMEEYRQGRTDSYWRGLLGCARDRIVILVYGGNQHYSDFLLAQEPLIDFVDSEDRDDIQQGASMVPRRLALEHFRRPLENLRRLIADIKREGAALVAVLGTPPPRRDYMTALDDFRANPLFQNFARQRGMDITRVSPTPARTMLKLWRVLQEAMEGIAASEGALFIPVSAEMFGPDGHLAERYRGAVEDFTHANREYGDLMLERAVRAANAEAKRGSSV